MQHSIDVSLRHSGVVSVRVLKYGAQYLVQLTLKSDKVHVSLITIKRLSLLVQPGVLMSSVYAQFGAF